MKFTYMNPDGEANTLRIAGQTLNERAMLERYASDGDAVLAKIVGPGEVEFRRHPQPPQSPKQEPPKKAKPRAENNNGSPEAS